MEAPFRRAFDAALNPLAARNALGIEDAGGGGGSGFITAVTPPLQVTGTTLSIDLSAYSTTAQIAAAYQPLDADLTAIAALTGTNVIYYRSAADTWAPVTIGANLTFSGGTLAATGGGGGGAPGGSNTQVQFNDSSAFGGAANLTWNKTTSVLTLTGQLAINIGSANSIVAAGVVEASSFKCTGTLAIFSTVSSGQVILRPAGPSTATGQVQILTTSVVMNSPVTLPADPTANLHAATKQYVDLRAPLASPTFTGDPKAPTPTAGDNDTSIATTAFVTAAVTAAGGAAFRTILLTNYGGGSGNHTLNANCVAWEAWWVGGGGGGGGSGTSASAIGGVGGTTSFGGVTAIGGTGGSASGGNGLGGSGGSGGVGTAIRAVGGDGASGAGAGSAAAYTGGGSGGASFFGGGGRGGIGSGGATGQAWGSGGGGGSAPAAVAYAGGGGGAAQFCYWYNGAATGGSVIAYVVGAVGSAGGAGTSGFSGGQGASGFIMIKEYLK